MNFYSGPLARNNAVYAGISDRAICPDQMVSKYSIELCAESFNCTPTSLIEEVSATLHRNAVQRFECVTQK
jgi:hypothetical protein